MLNRHATVLFLGIAALWLLRQGDVGPSGVLATGFLLALIGLLLDQNDRRDSFRSIAAHGLQATAAAMLFYDAAWLVSAGAVHLALGELAIVLVLVGLLIEMRMPYRWLKTAIATQALGDVLFLAGAGVAVVGRSGRQSVVGWVFIGIAGALGLYAAISNLALQVARLRNRQAGWRFRVLSVDDAGIQVKTPQGQAQIPWRVVEAVQRLDDRQVLLVLPSPLPPELKGAGLPLEELRIDAEPLVGEHVPPPDRYGLVLHEQELGQPVDDAQSLLAGYLSRRVSA